MFDDELRAEYLTTEPRDTERLLLIVCPACQKGRKKQTGGVIATVQRSVSPVTGNEFVYFSTFNTGGLPTPDDWLSRPQLAVRLTDRWVGVVGGMPDGLAVDRLDVLCGHGRRSIPTAEIDAVLARPRRRRRPGVIVSPPPND